MPKKKSTPQMAQTKQCQYVQRSNEKARNKSDRSRQDSNLCGGSPIDF